MAASPTAGLSQGPVDRLTTYFFKKFQETKSESELSALQCTTQLKFEEIEKTIRGHAQGFDTLQEQMRHFRDKAPALFLQKISDQINALGASSSGRTDLALDRFHQRLDDEVKNLTDQLSDTSTKLAVNTANLNAKIEDAKRKTKTGDEMTANNLLQCETGFQSKLSKLMRLLESSKIEEESERRRLFESLHNTNMKLQQNSDKLEIIVTQQSEQLAIQEKKIKQLETETQSIVRLINWQKETKSMTRALPDHKEELVRIQEPEREIPNQQRKSKAISGNGQTVTDYDQGTVTSSVSFQYSKDV